MKAEHRPHRRQARRARLPGRDWASPGIRALPCENLDDLRVVAAGDGLETWPEGPYNVRAADLDLWQHSHGAAGGLVGAELATCLSSVDGHHVPVLLRSADVEDDRSLAAVLAVERVGTHLLLWGKSVEQTSKWESSRWRARVDR